VQSNEAAIAYPLRRVPTFNWTVQASRLRLGLLPISFFFKDFPTQVFGLNAQQLAHAIEAENPIAPVPIDPNLGFAKTLFTDSVMRHAVMPKAVDRVFQYGEQ